MHNNFLFDLDQTLLDFHASEKKALEIIVTKLGFRFSDDVYFHFKEYNKSLWLKLEKGTISRTELFTMRFGDLISYCKGDPSGFNLLEINDEFIYTMSVNGVLMEGALEFAKRIKDEINDSRIYIVSNGAVVNATGRIRSTGLDKYIDGIYISEALGVNKPSTEFFDICLKDIGEPKETCIVIGDSLTSDMLGAQNASMASVWFMPQGDIGKAMITYGIDYCASSFDELFVILRDWASQNHNKI